MSKRTLRLQLEQPGGVKQTILLIPNVPEPVYCESYPLPRRVRRCRNCKRYEWSGDPATYGTCKQWVLQGAHLVVAAIHGPIRPGHYLEPDPGFYCNAWEGES